MRWKKGLTKRNVERLAALGIVSAVAGVASGCADPGSVREREELGEEEEGVPEGPLHRPGQPCLVCHGEDSEEAFVLAGTIYDSGEEAKPVEGVRVRVIDFLGVQAETTTNSAGNFFLYRSEFEPAWPIWVKLESRSTTREMQSPIQREGSCAGCHEGDGSPSKPTRIYLDPPAEGSE